MDKKFIIRCRAIIIHEGKLLVVKHTPESAFYALPGGHLEWGEDIKECMSRELEEELGVRGEIGRLFYVNTFIDEGVQSVEFFFEIKNAKDYVSTSRPVRIACERASRDPVGWKRRRCKYITAGH